MIQNNDQTDLADAPPTMTMTILSIMVEADTDTDSLQQQ